MTIEQILSEFDKNELGSLDWCGDEDHECECAVKTKAIKAFLTASLTSFGKSEYERGKQEGIQEAQEDYFEAGKAAEMFKVAERLRAEEV